MNNKQIEHFATLSKTEQEKYLKEIGVKRSPLKLSIKLRKEVKKPQTSSASGVSPPSLPSTTVRMIERVITAPCQDTASPTKQPEPQRETTPPVSLHSRTYSLPVQPADPIVKPEPLFVRSRQYNHKQMEDCLKPCNLDNIPMQEHYTTE